MDSRWRGGRMSGVRVMGERRGGTWRRWEREKKSGRTGVGWEKQCQRERKVAGKESIHQIYSLLVCDFNLIGRSR